MLARRQSDWSLLCFRNQSFWDFDESSRLMSIESFHITFSFPDQCRVVFVQINPIAPTSVALLGLCSQYTIRTALTWSSQVN